MCSLGRPVLEGLVLILSLALRTDPSIVFSLLSVILKVETLDQQQQHHLGTWMKCISGPTPGLLIQKSGGGAQPCVF